MLVGTGGASPSLASCLGLIRLAPRGGSGLERTGPEIDFFRCGAGERGSPRSACSLSLGSLVALYAPGAERGSDGLLDGASWRGFFNGKVCDRSATRRGFLSSSAAGGPNPPYPAFFGTLGAINPDLDPDELLVDVRECPAPAVAGRTIDPPTSAVLDDIVISFRLLAVAFLWCRERTGPPVGEFPAPLRPFTSNGPGAIVFIL